MEVNIKITGDYATINITDGDDEHNEALFPDRYKNTVRSGFHTEIKEFSQAYKKLYKPLIETMRAIGRTREEEKMKYFEGIGAFDAEISEGDLVYTCETKVNDFGEEYSVVSKGHRIPEEWHGVLCWKSKDECQKYCDWLNKETVLN